MFHVQPRLTKGHISASFFWRTANEMAMFVRWDLEDILSSLRIYFV